MRALLTQRESEIAALVSRGLRSKEIARLLGVSPATISFHIGHVLRKPGPRIVAIWHAAFRGRYRCRAKS